MSKVPPICTEFFRVPTLPSTGSKTTSHRRKTGDHDGERPPNEPSVGHVLGVAGARADEWTSDVSRCRERARWLATEACGDVDSASYGYRPPDPQPRPHRHGDGYAHTHAR